MYGSQARALTLDASHIKSFCSTWWKVIRKLWGLPNIARSSLVPHLVNAPPTEGQLYQRTANAIRKGHHPKFLLLLELSTNTDKMRIMAKNTRIISNRWLCGFNRLKRNFVKSQSHEIATRVSLIKNLTTCEIPGLTNDDFVEMKNFIAWKPCGSNVEDTRKAHGSHEAMQKPRGRFQESAILARVIRQNAKPCSICSRETQWSIIYACVFRSFRQTLHSPMTTRRFTSPSRANSCVHFVST